MQPQPVAQRQGVMHEVPLVQVLGAVRFVTDGGSTITLPSASQRRLLALLALAAGTTVRSEHLCEVFGLSTGALRTTVSRLRRRLGEDAIVTDAVGYRLACSVDATRFATVVTGPDDRSDRLAELETALAMWHGPVLDEFRHEVWAHGDATRLDELRCLAIEERDELLIRRGRSGEVVAALQAYLAEHPLRDRPRALLMEALAEQGRPSEALRRSQEYRELLAEQTGLEPSGMLRSIERRIAAGSVDPMPVGHPVDADGARDPAASTSSRAFVPLPGPVTLGATLLGRDREFDVLEDELARARSGRLRAVVLSGEAGIGRTTLLAAFARRHRAHDDATVLYGRCEDGGAVPLQPLRGIAEHLVEYAPLDLLRTHCERFGGELLRVAPRLAGRLWVPPPLAADSAVERHRLFAAMTDLFRSVAAAGPVVIVLEDLHWAERSALLLVRHLARELADAPVLLVVSYRDVGERIPPELRSTLSDLDCLDATRIHLAGLDADGLAALVASVAAADAPVAPHAVDQLLDQTAGNPLYAVHLVQHLVDVGALVVDAEAIRLTEPVADTGVPDSLVEVVWSRVEVLGPEAQFVLRAASVLGVEFDERVLRSVCAKDDDEMAAILDASVEAGLLVDGGSDGDGGSPASMRFTHAFVARALKAELGSSGRRRLHERAANASRRPVALR